MILASALLAFSSVAFAVTPLTEKTVLEGPEALYNLDYEEARARIRKLIDAEPDNPFGYIFEAGAIWWQSSNEYGLFIDTPTLEGLFETDVRTAIAKSEAYQQSNDPKVQAEGYFTGGMAMGTLGEWHLLRRHWLKAYFEGKKSIKLLNKALKLNPELYDVYLGLGIYDYEADHLPGVLKISSFLLVRGDSKRGLQRMQLASAKGKVVASQAAQYLASTYILGERNYAEALKLIRLLRERFPESAYFQFLETMTLFRTGDIDGSYREARGVFLRVAKDPEILGRKQLSLLCGLDGPKCFDPAGLASAIEWLNRAIARAPADGPAGWPTLLRFYRGVVYDLAGQHTQAIADYEQVLADPPLLNVQTWAKSCILNQCDREWVLRTLKELSLSQSPSGPAPAPKK
ncbi:MAG: hypothetical protein HY078_15985 [Elusimicrobia bacterium]|nr:hypothetical protein [Elusimicrobiota bacterium]